MFLVGKVVDGSGNEDGVALEPGLRGLRRRSKVQSSVWRIEENANVGRERRENEQRVGPKGGAEVGWGLKREMRGR